MNIGSTWNDRRPIGRIIFAQQANESLTNINGWDNTGPVNLGTSTFQSSITTTVNTAITNTTTLGGQGIIIWDITGTGSTSYAAGGAYYLGDPRFLNPSASGLTTATAYSPYIPPSSTLGINGIEPAMEAIADSLFTSIRNAGLKVGVCLRAQKVNVNGSGAIIPTGTFGSTQPNYDTILNQLTDLDAKLTYAYNRWGCRLFYVDSNAASNDVAATLQNQSIPTTTPAYVYTQLRSRHPDCLIFPEQVFDAAFSTSPIAQINHAVVSASNTNALALGQNVIAGNSIVICVEAGISTATVTSLSDTLGNSYSLIETVSGYGGSNLWLYICHSSLAGANTVTATVSNANGFLLLAYAEITGTAGTVQAHTHNTGTSSSPTTGAATTTTTQTLLIGRVSNETSSFVSSPNTSAHALLYQFETSIGTYALTETVSGSNNWGSVMMSIDLPAYVQINDPAYQYLLVASQYTSINPVGGSPYLTSPEIAAVPDAFTLISCANLGSSDPTDKSAVTTALMAGQAILMADVWYSDPSITLVLDWQTSFNNISGLSSSVDSSLLKTVLGFSSGTFTSPSSIGISLHSAKFGTGKVSITEWPNGGSTNTNYTARISTGPTNNGSGVNNWSVAAFSSGTGCSAYNLNQIAFSALTGTGNTVRAVGFWDSLVYGAGNLLWFFDVDAASVSPGIIVQFNVGYITMILF